jgi:hypothetical protein
MDTQRGQKPEGRSERQRPRLLQSSDRWDAKAARAKAKDEEGRREAKVFLLSHGRHEEEAYFSQDSERSEQPYKQEP